MKINNPSFQLTFGKPVVQPILLVAILLLVICSACGSSETAPPTQTATSTPLGDKVTFTTEDGVRLAGTLFGEGEPAVILAHQGTAGADQTTWRTFARVLAEHGYATLTFDFRGIGRSSGIANRNKLDLDLAAAVQFMRDQGHKRIVCIGASMGGTTCIRRALDGEEFEGLVTLSSATITGVDTGIEVSEEELGSLTLPTLFITAEGDSDLVVTDTTHMYESSPEPKALYLLPGRAHGAYLFNTDAGDELTTILLEFLKNLPEP